MNEDVLKPFPCKENDCSMSFFTEDHLSVHQEAKHRKLNLEIPKGSSIIFADQTPTPTRLLKNCEELRVFDDLQNINPFEEGFRRAVEYNGNESDHTFVSSSYQDTLHTPQIIPPIDNCSMKIDDGKQLPDQIEHESLKNIPKTAKLKEISSIIHQIPLLPKPVLLPMPTIFTCVSQISESEYDKDKNSVKNKLKNICNDRKRKLEVVPPIIIGSSLEATSSLSIIENENIRTANNDNTFDSKNSLSIEVDIKRPKVEKTEFSNLKVERNRAAARRYRTKMKIQSQALQEKYEKSQKELSAVKKELSELKKELTNVKALLLVHKDCPVSKIAIINSQQ